MDEDEISRFRVVAAGWRDRDEKGKAPTENNVPGSVTSLQGYRGTSCRVHDPKALARVLSGEQSLAYQEVVAARTSLARAKARSGNFIGATSSCSSISSFASRGGSGSACLASR